jgi:hypothetical protein
VRSDRVELAAVHAAGPLGAVGPRSSSSQESASGTTLERLDGATNDERRDLDLFDGMRGITVISPPFTCGVRHGFTQ